MGKNLTLTGMMGVGKSTIGKILAKKLEYNFIDIDKLIEDKEGLSINLIFKNKGYGTKKHLEAIKEFGIVEGHRKSFKPCCNY